MPRVRKQKTIADEPTGPKGFVASAMQVAAKQVTIRRLFKTQEWQTEAWEMYDQVGEFRYAMNWRAMAASRAELLIQVKNASGDWEDATDVVARAYLDELLESCGGESEFLRTEFLHLGVPGESFIVGQDITTDAGVVVGYRWRVVEAQEIDLDAKPPTITDPDTGDKEKLDEGALIIRVWRPHPRDSARADSAALASLDPLREIVNIGKHIAATVDSRLAGNGALLLPNEVSITTADGVTTPGDATADEGDPFMQTMVAAMVSPISDRDSPSAVVPVILRMPGQFIQYVQHLTFGTKFDEQTQPLRDAAVKRLALTLDMPPEQLLGLGESNHWSAWQIEEAGVKTGIEPDLQLICNAITRQYLRPLIEADAGKAMADRVRIWYSVQNLVQRPNLADDADKAFDRFAIGFKAYLEAKGFDPADAPSEDEMRMMLMLTLAKDGKVDPLIGARLGLPSTVKDAAPTSAPISGSPADPNAGPDTTPGTDTRALPGKTAAPAPAPAKPTPTPVGQSALLAAAEALVLRALERAGNKRRTHRDESMLASVPDHETHMHLPVTESQVERLLANAWTLVGPIAHRHQVDPAAFTTVLEDTTRHLLVGQYGLDDQHRARLADALADLTPTEEAA